MPYTLVRNLHLTPRQDKILQQILKINHARGCLNWSYEQIARYFHCSRSTIKRIFEFLRFYGLLEEIRQGAYKYLKRIKEGIQEYLSNPFQWVQNRLKKPLFLSLSEPSLEPSPGPSLDPSFPREKCEDIHIRKESKSSSIDIGNENDVQKDEKVGKTTLLTPKSKNLTYKSTEQYVFLSKMTATTSDNLCYGYMPFDSPSLQRYCSLPINLAVAVVERYNYVKNLQTIQNPSAWLMSESSKAETKGADYVPKYDPSSFKEEIQPLVDIDMDLIEKVETFAENFHLAFKNGYGLRYDEYKLVMFTPYMVTEVDYTDRGFEELKRFYQLHKS